MGGLPEEVTVIFQAQNGCRRLLVIGQTAVAHCKRPKAFSIALVVITVFWIRSSRTSKARMCFVEII